MTKQLAYAIVLNDLLECSMFNGIYDAENGSEHFMRGISTVMENIAYHVSKDCADDFLEMFIANMINSEERRKIK